MQSYLRLEWSKHHRRCEQRMLESFAIDFSRYEEDIFNLHINETDAVHQLGDTFEEPQISLNLPIDPRTGQEVKQLEIDTTKSVQFYDHFPSGSRLSRAEHQHCLAVLNRMNMRLPFDSPEDREAYSQFCKMFVKLETERGLFESFVKNLFNTNLVSRKRTIPQELNTLVVSIWREKIRKLLESIPDSRYYLTTAVMWLRHAQCERNVQFEPVSDEAVELGAVRHLFTEHLFSRSTLRRSDRVMAKFYEDQIKMQQIDDPKLVRGILEQDNDLRFVLSSGTFCDLLDNINDHQRQWMIPFEISYVAGRKVIFLGKQLQPTKMLTGERNLKGHKYLVRTFTKLIKKDELQLPMDKADKVQLSSAEFQPVEFDCYMKNIEAKLQPTDTPQKDSFLRLWKLQDGDEQYRFLVKSHTDFYESHRKIKFHFNISIKMEYQAEFGAEQMTKSELIREWTRQLLRPNSKTLRLRINPVNSSIISNHYLELKDIEEELRRLHNIEPRTLITSLWQTLKILLNFPPGRHLMQHDVKNPETVNILSNDASKPADSGASLNLKEYYAKVEFERCALEEYEWIPIDRNVITKMHRELTLMPCTFPHWHNVERLVPRERLKPKRPPPKPVPLEGKKKKSRAQRIRRKLKEREKKDKKEKEKIFVNEIQQSLDQYAPYEGPSRRNRTTEGLSSPINKTFVKGGTFNFGPESNNLPASKNQTL
ncbi:little elongation complex subunit 2 [Uranotaenia lowii]|uniref:little elongation complex subunit 2 n=1 Tax=Uranotaenia lowii TaxID=190385 RepID=UPI002478B87B|nr:little elongation complex subunit 2 [Uranotaenia lowii]